MGVTGIIVIASIIVVSVIRAGQGTEAAGTAAGTAAGADYGTVGVVPHSATYIRATLPLTALLAADAAMRATLQSGRRSQSPDEPVLVRATPDATLWEVADGHHRIAHALREGRTHITVDIDPVPDDEPLTGPFYDFTHDGRWGAGRTPPPPRTVA